MIADIEQEYNECIRNMWQKFPDVTNDILKYHREPEHKYNIVSLGAIQFLQDKVKSLTTEKS